jgi:hypothetical protein
MEFSFFEILGCIFGLVGSFILSSKHAESKKIRRYCFICFLICNLCFILFGLLYSHYFLLALQIFYAYTSIRGIMNNREIGVIK